MSQQHLSYGIYSPPHDVFGTAVFAITPTTPPRLTYFFFTTTAPEVIKTHPPLELIEFSKKKYPEYSSPVYSPENKTLTELTQNLERYFNGMPVSWNIEFDLQGTDFQKKVWNLLSTIPYGTIQSYRDLAEQIGSPKAVRAVG